jgi:hypothetical protein
VEAVLAAMGWHHGFRALRAFRKEQYGTDQEAQGPD